MAWEKDPDRVAVNQHVHRYHDGAALTGDTMSRYVQHELLHDNEFGLAGKPSHWHRFTTTQGRAAALEPLTPEGSE